MTLNLPYIFEDLVKKHLSRHHKEIKTLLQINKFNNLDYKPELLNEKEVEEINEELVFGGVLNSCLFIER